MSLSNGTMVTAPAQRLGAGLGPRRHWLGLSAREVAGLAGVSRTTVQNAESGRASAEATLRVANALLAFQALAVPLSSNGREAA